MSRTATKRRGKDPREEETDRQQSHKVKADANGSEVKTAASELATVTILTHLT